MSLLVRVVAFGKPDDVVPGNGASLFSRVRRVTDVGGGVSAEINQIKPSKRIDGVFSMVRFV